MLKSLNLNSMSTTHITQLVHVLLTHYTDNQLKSLGGLSKLRRLEILEVRGNQLTDMNEIDAPALKELYAAQNQITNLEGLGRMHTLEVLHLRGNQISNLEGLHKLVNLKTLNLR